MVFNFGNSICLDTCHANTIMNYANGRHKTKYTSNDHDNCYYLILLTIVGRRRNFLWHLTTWKAILLTTAFVDAFCNAITLIGYELPRDRVMHDGLDESSLSTEVFPLISTVIRDYVESRCPLAVGDSVLDGFFTGLLFNNVDAAIRRALGEAHEVLDQETIIRDIR